jgi:hypothetical protein
MGCCGQLKVLSVQIAFYVVEIQYDYGGAVFVASDERSRSDPRSSSSAKQNFRMNFTKLQS